MAEITKLGMDNMCGLEQMGTQKISVISDQTNGFHQKGEKSDSFILDIDSFSHAIDRDMTQNSRFQRSLSRKGSQRFIEKKPNSNDKESIIASSSPRAALVGTTAPESPVAVVVGTTDHPITITAASSNNSSSASIESKFGSRRNSFRRSTSSWAIDSRKILFFFATLSSMGTILLIYFTLSTVKMNESESDALNWPQ